ncbi:MAG: hypothetical protein JWR26_2542 [Pedosphaera sp.]|nr:hypothetical protein [Pedosphaera sp.]
MHKAMKANSRSLNKPEMLPIKAGDPAAATKTGSVPHNNSACNHPIKSSPSENSNGVSSCSPGLARSESLADLPWETNLKSPTIRSRSEASPSEHLLAPPYPAG